MAETVQLDQHYTGPQACALLGGISARTLARWIDRGRETKGRHGIWPVFKPTERSLLIPATAIRRFLEARKA